MATSTIAAGSSSSYPSAASASALLPTTSAYGLPDALPHTSNRWIKLAGDLSLYNPTLILAAAALLQHTAVFGVLFLLRGFSPKRALDLHYLTIIFALSFVAAPVVFLVDLRIDQVKLLFFLEHEAVEFLIAIRVLAPTEFVARRSGLIVLVCWYSLVAITVPVAWDLKFHHAADIVAWCAFCSDLLVGIAGYALVRRWMVTDLVTTFGRRKMRAEAMAGLGFMLHGFITMAVGPIFTLVLYHNLNPAYFAYALVALFFSAFFAVGFAVPVAGIFFSNIRWCVTHRKAAFPGQAEWQEQYADKVELEVAMPWPLQVPHKTDGSAASARTHNVAWNTRSPGERTSAWQSHRRTNSNIYYRDVLKDLLAR